MIGIGTLGLIVPSIEHAGSIWIGNAVVPLLIRSLFRPAIFDVYCVIALTTRVTLIMARMLTKQCEEHFP